MQSVISNTLRDALKVRPNTGLPQSFLQKDMIICTGEDPTELIDAMRSTFPGKLPRVHQYRCYRAWKYQGFTVVLSGIGTGCLEPLMFEVLDCKNLGNRVPRRLIMIGSAGYLSDTGFGQVYLVDGAYPVGCGVTLNDRDLPVRPKFEGLDRVRLPRAEEISSDYYYACTPDSKDERKVRANMLDPGLRKGLARYWKPGRLISMEAAQFYHYAAIYGQPGTQYVAFRGVANLVQQFETQGDYSLQVLTEGFRQAVKLLAYTTDHR